MSEYQGTKQRAQDEAWGRAIGELDWMAESALRGESGMIQPNLFNAPPVIPVAPSLPAEERRRLSAQCLKILEKLKAGPATNLQLAVIGYRYGARIHELRKAGYEIVITSKNVETGETTYELRGGE